MVKFRENLIYAYSTIPLFRISHLTNSLKSRTFSQVGVPQNNIWLQAWKWIGLQSSYDNYYDYGNASDNI